MNQNRADITKGVDSLMIFLYIIIAVIGLLCIFSVEYRPGDKVIQSFLGFHKEYSKQFFYLGICAVLAIFILLTDSKFFTATANLSYLGGILLVLATFVVGKEVKGSKSWIQLGSAFSIQPVELCKIFVSLALAKYLSQPEMDFRKQRSQMIAALLVFTPAIFSIMQGETGLALVYFCFLIPMYREGLSPAYLIIGAAMGVLLVVSLLFPARILIFVFTGVTIALIYLLKKLINKHRQLLLIIISVWLFCSLFVGVAVPFAFKHVFKGYQSDRIYSMLGVDNPYANNNDASNGDEVKEKERKKKQQDYNVKQSKIAIGSGGLLGKGFLKGTQTQGDFVPEQHTDFIFTSVGENFGFLGSTMLMLIYLGVLFRIVYIAERQRSTFSRVYAYSVAGIIFFHVAVNICVTIGLAPVIGITLPLMSYGGSSLITFTVLIFVLIKLDADRQMILR
jgi:rod shape determining protein RodA